MKVLLTPFALMAIIHLGQAAPLLPMGKYLAYTNRAERNVVVLNAQGEKQFSIADATQPSLSPDANASPSPAPNIFAPKTGKNCNRIFGSQTSPAGRNAD